MKICMMSLMMDECPVNEIVKTALECGMEAIDWIGLHGCRAEFLKKVCDDAGLYSAAHTMIKSGFLTDNAGYFDEFKSSLDDARVMGAPVMMIPPFPRINQTSLEDDRRRYIDYYARCCEYAVGSGVTLTLESTGYHNSPITTADECLEVFRQVPDLRLTYDQGNVATADDPVEAFMKLRKYVVHFHVKDWYVFDKANENTTPKRCGKHFADATIGEGDMDIKSFWQLTTPEERQIFVNPETRDYTGKRNAVDIFKQVCAELQSYEN